MKFLIIEANWFCAPQNSDSHLFQKFNIWPARQSNTNDLPPVFQLSGKVKNAKISRRYVWHPQKHKISFSPDQKVTAILQKLQRQEGKSSLRSLLPRINQSKTAILVVIPFSASQFMQ